MTPKPSFRRSRDLDKSSKFRQMQELTNDYYSEIKIHNIFHIAYKAIEFRTNKKQPTITFPIPILERQRDSPCHGGFVHKANCVCPVFVTGFKKKYLYEKVFFACMIKVVCKVAVHHSLDCLSTSPPCCRLRHLLASVFEERRNIRRELMELECSSRDIVYKIHRKERSLARLDAVVMETDVHDKVRQVNRRRSVGFS